MLQDENVWSVVYYGQFVYFTQPITLTGTTTVNDVIYYKVAIDGEEISCLVREEGTVVYFLPSGPNSDELIMYDFNLEEGDTFNIGQMDTPCIGNGSFFNTGYVVEVTQENIAGQERKVIKFSESQNSTIIIDTWIEGIGSLYGFDSFGETFHTRTDLACFSNNQITTMFNGFEECSFFILSTDENLIEQFILSPNPVSEIATLTLPLEITLAQIRVFDLNGKKLLEQHISEENTSIDFSSLQSGMYFYQIFSENELVVTKKLIVR